MSRLRENAPAGQGWFTAAELAAMGLPEFPSHRRNVEKRAADEGWVSRTARNGDPLARDRKGRGGGLEYHYSLLPPAAQAALVARGLAAAAPDAGDGLDARLAVFEALPDAEKAKAHARLAVIDNVAALRKGGATQTAAVAQAAQAAKMSSSAVFALMARVRGLERRAWLPALADRPRGHARRADLHPDAWAFIKADWLRPEKPSFESCWDRLRAAADAHGWVLPSSRTAKRRLMELPESLRVLKREGREALHRMYPAQVRDRSHFHALEAVNADGHKFDVFVKFGDGKIRRPVMLAVQDLYSGKVLAHRIAQSEGADLVRLAFGDVFAQFGIPRHAWLDNGRGFASKWITGGTPNRFRFKVKEEDPVGALTLLGVQVHWTLPYSGQSKPIERAFRDMCDRIAKHPAFAGAYTGNKPDAKPENYGARAVPIATFRKIVAEEIALHNARPSRRSRVCNGVLSFDQAFEQSFAAAHIPRATPAMLRHCLLAGERLKADRNTGAVTLFGNRYWCEALTELRGQHVVVRFDPDALHIPVQIYRMDGAHVAEAPLWEMSGFASAADGREHARARGAWKKAQKALADAEVRLKPADLAAMLPCAEPAPAPEAAVIRLVTGRGPVIAGPQTENPKDREERFMERFTRAAQNLG